MAEILEKALDIALEKKDPKKKLERAEAARRFIEREIWPESKNPVVYVR